MSRTGQTRSTSVPKTPASLHHTLLTSITHTSTNPFQQPPSSADPRTQEAFRRSPSLLAPEEPCGIPPSHTGPTVHLNWLPVVASHGPPANRISRGVDKFSAWRPGSRPPALVQGQSPHISERQFTFLNASSSAVNCRE